MITPPCRHTYDEYGNAICSAGVNMDPDPCGKFRSLGFGPEGDFEHALFCVCGWERAEHLLADDEF